ncbi:MAG: sarcosine oxidase subunit gamma [Roseobacter sp.]|nr:sarcosine oxidase subunit gamma [Roseobacter sp.]
MTELKAVSPAAGLLPLSIGGVTLREDEMRPLTLIAPYKGQEAALAKALSAAHGLSWPAAGATSANGAARLVWFGRNAAILVGVQAAAKLAKHAALTDQSDAWSCVVLEGAGARDVLARLTPVDLRDGAFPLGATARTEVFHMACSITRLEAESWQIMGFRSMAKTLVHDLKTAMEGVAARAL